MLIAARNSFLMGGAKPWTNPYVTDGLVAMWDGEWNAGGGVHDAGATVWKDLVGGIELPLMAGGSWGSNCIIGDGSAPAAGVVTPPNILKQPFCEVVYKMLAYPARNGAVAAFSVKYLSTETFYKDFGLVDSYGTTYFLANQRLTRTSGDNYIGINCVSIDADSRSSYRAFYVNSITRSQAGGSGHGAFNQGMYVCALPYSGVGYTYPSKAKVYCIRFYNRALSPAEIAHNYAIDKARFNLS
jgi:hypothetical protein